MSSVSQAIARRLPLVLFVFIIFSALSAAFNHDHKAHHTHHPRRHAQNDITPSSTIQVLRRQDTGTDTSGQTGGSGSSSSSGDYTCGPGKPCGNGACCGKDGWCGYSPKYCGDGCQSNCDAKAECGEYAVNKGQSCPLNVCCSEFGFCGTTSDFCGDGCQSNCDQPKPSASEGDVQKKIIAYWEGWNSNHACGTMTPSEIPIDKITHLFMAFGYVNPGDYKIMGMPDVDAKLYQAVPNLKLRNPNLKVAIALGGWTFNDPGSYQSVFPSMVSSQANRAAAIKNILGFLAEYGFDGVDFDWEYPGADERGGSASDGKNFTQFLKELKAAIKAEGHDYFVTFTAPTSYWYLRHFDLTAMTEHVDWIQLMSYDLHGTWDRDNPIGSQVLAHTNITEIDLALDLFWRNDIDPKKIVLGLGFYGRSFQLSDSSCWKPGCEFSGPGAKGPCTDTAGILSYKEITDIIKSTGAKPYYDEVAKVNYLVYKGNNWISYDDKKSFQAKIDYANKMGLDGIMVWAIDQDDSDHSALEAISPINTQLADALQLTLDQGPAVSHDYFSASSCYVMTECGEMCPSGYRSMTRVGRLSGQKTCPEDNFRYVCCPSWSAPELSQCHWAENRTSGVKTDCAGTCNPGQIKIAGDSWGWKGDLETGNSGGYCSRGGVTFCCDAGNSQQYLDICSWTTCDGSCASEYPDKPYALTTDTGGPNDRCDYTIENPHDPIEYYSYEHRTLCCPRENSFLHCDWHSKKECSESCPNNQIEIDSDPYGPEDDEFSCWASRRGVFCCDPPGGLDKPFLPVDLDKIFPSEYLPNTESVPKYDLVNWGGLADQITDPAATSIAFFLIAGNEYAVSQLKKRNTEPEAFTFITCPTDVLDRPTGEAQVARVVCLSDDVENCFRVRRGGVEGTIVEMPDNCGQGSWARALSLEISKDQTVPAPILNDRRRKVSSHVYDFVFDYNMSKMKRDAGPTSIRIDYSNAINYWDALVDSDGVQSKKRSEGRIDPRYFSGSMSDWKSKHADLEFADGSSVAVSESVKKLLYFEKELSCDVANMDENLPEAFAAGISGDISAKLWMGFSLVATIEANKLIVHETAGFLRLEGSTDLTFDIGGLGDIDASKMYSGNPATQNDTLRELGGHKIFKGWLHFAPYLRTWVGMGTKGSSDLDSKASFDGRASVRVKSDFGKFNAYFPDSDDPQSANSKRDTDSIQVSTQNVLNAAGVGSIQLSHGVEVGLEVTLTLPSNIGTGNGKFPSLKIDKETFVDFELSDDDVAGSTCLDYKIQTLIGQQASPRDGSQDYDSVNWSSAYSPNVQLANKLLQPDSGKCFSTLKKRDDVWRGTQDVSPPQCGSSQKSESKKKRQSGGGLIGWPSLTFGKTPELISIDMDKYVSESLDAAFPDTLSYTCTTTKEDGDPCCGCASLDWLLGYADIDCEECERPDPGTWPGNGIPLRRRGTNDGFGDELEEEDNTDDEESHSLDKRVLGKATISPKKVTVCPARKKDKVSGSSYPAFPADASFPWDGIENGKWDPIAKYYGNISADCSNWNVDALPQADSVLLPNGNTVRAVYQVEHVFEGQIVGQFFTDWLDQGVVPHQIVTGSPTTRLDCNWSRNYVRNQLLWTVDGRTKNFVQYMMAELGQVNHLDRLTVYLGRPNGMKGALFEGNKPIALDYFRLMEADVQLQAVKQFGMAFVYMNRPEVWSMFCASYEAIYTKLQEFDTWYAQQIPGAQSNLAAEWPTYVRVLLDNIVMVSRAQFNWYYANRKIEPSGTAVGGSSKQALYEFKWYENTVNNRRLFNLVGTCPNLGPTNVAPATSGDPDAVPT